MDEELFSIGETARRSGLSVSALRFYDRVSMLEPHRVDPISGYRWYSSDQIRIAELIAKLRQVGLALPEVSRILSNQGDTEVLREVLDEHVTRLERGLSSAKSVISQLESFWSLPDSELGNSTIKVSAHELMNALNSVRFAVGKDNEYPALQGILLETVQDKLRIMTTDRYRAAFYTLDSESAASGLRAVLATHDLDELLVLLEPGGIAELTQGAGLTVALGKRTMMCELLEEDFPDLNHIVPSTSGLTRTEVDREWLQQFLETEPDAERWLIDIDSIGQLVLEASENSSNAKATALDASYFAEAIDAVGGDHLRLELNGPIAPLAIRRTDNPNSFSILMPRLREKP